MLAFVVLPLSGCISADAFYDQMDDEFKSWGDDWNDEYDEWESDSDDADNDNGSSSSGGSDEEPCPIDMVTGGSSGSGSGSGSDPETEPEDEDEDDPDDFESEVSARDIKRAFRDADPRYSNFIDGDEDSKRSINVDWRDDTLRVGLVHHIEGDVEIQLRNPLGILIAEEQFDGRKEMNEEEWYSVEDPMPGDWTLSIEIDNGYGGYAVGFYLDE